MISALSTTARQPAARSRRIAAERAGRFAEYMAIGLLVLRGYRILARRWRCAAGELDIIAVRGRRLACVEVKYRTDDEAAHHAVSARQRRRLCAAAEAFCARFDRYAGHERAFDAVFVVAAAWPVYAADHLRPDILTSH